MIVTRLELDNFRNYGELRLDLEPGLSVFEGPNAQGKTTLLESICTLALGRSFRSSSDQDLIRWDTDLATAAGTLQRTSGRKRHLKIRWARGGAKTVLLQNHPVERLSDFLCELPLTLFTPDDLSLVQGAPAERRRYLDQLLCKLYPSYLEALSRYQKVLKARTVLLRSYPPVAREEMEPWEDMAIATGCELTRQREEMCTILQRLVLPIHAMMAPGEEPMRLEYRSAGSPDREEFGERMKAARRQEMQRRCCLVGPHRDELKVAVGDLDLRRFGSQGQRRTASLTLRLAQARALEEIGGESAVVLLDDCLSELDPQRQSGLLEHLADNPQVLITTATPLALPGPSRLYRVEGGQVELVS